MTRLLTAAGWKTTVPGVAALILAVAAGSALLVLVFRGAPRDDLAEWGITLGLFLQTINNLLTAAHGPGRATDPRPPTEPAL